MSDAITLESVSKRYGRTVALEDLSLSFQAGVLTGFLGPNGAGKTTTFRTILGLTRPQRGSVTVLGMRVGPATHRIVKRVGAVVEEPGLHKTLTGRDNLRVAAFTLGSGIDQIPELLEFVSLTNVADRKVSGYSKGMRQRLALAMAMLADPDVLILDEPLDGLDPAGQVTLKTQLRSLVDHHAKTVIVSSHVLSDVEQIADRIVVIDQGRLVASGSLQDVTGTGNSFRVEVDDPEKAVLVLRGAGLDSRAEDGAVRVTTDDGTAISRALAEAGLYPAALVPERATLERVFLELTSGEVT